MLGCMRRTSQNGPLLVPPCLHRHNWLSVYVTITPTPDSWNQSLMHLSKYTLAFNKMIVVVRPTYIIVSVMLLS